MGIPEIRIGGRVKQAVASGSPPDKDAIQSLLCRCKTHPKNSASGDRFSFDTPMCLSYGAFVRRGIFAGRLCIGITH